MKTHPVRIAIALLAAALCAPLAFAQPRGERPPQFVSPEVMEDGKIAFRIHAPQAESVGLGGSDVPRGQDGKMDKNDEGVWEIVREGLEPGSYRYNFNVDGVAVIDPRNPLTSQSNMNVWSLVHLPGADFMDAKRVPRGAVAEVAYYSNSLGRDRRMHIYTPPGYASGKGTYPVFYLLHGAMDSDNSWSTVGRAGVILDNLIAAKQAKPMVVVMPAGHTGPFVWGRGLEMGAFVKDFNEDIKPYVESHYRIHKDREHTAIAGLSMGGAHTIDIALPNLSEYAYIGVYSSGIFGINGGFGGDSGPTWESRHEAVLDDAKLKDGLELFWFATGKDDFLVETSRATVEMFKKHAFDVTYVETEGGHTWKNWREYLHVFAPKLFQ